MATSPPPITSTFGADGGRLAAVDLAQEIQARPDARGVFAGDAQLAADPGAGRGEDGVEARTPADSSDRPRGVPVLASTPRSRMYWISLSSTSLGRR